MKSLALALTAAAGLALTAGTADAQYITYGNYSYPSYGSTYPAYYTAPSYYGGRGVVVTSGYSPVVSAPVYSGWNYYSPSAWAPTYDYSSGYYNRGYSSNYGYGNYGYGRGWRR